MTALSIQQSLDAAAEHHRAGRAAEAEDLCRQVLAQRPQHPGALHLLGVLAHQAGRHSIAAELMSRAVAGCPGDANLHNNLSVVLFSAGRIADAVAAGRTATSLLPHSAKMHLNLANALNASGQYEAAIASYRAATTLEPNHADVHNNLGTALMESGHLDEAASEFRRAIELQPDYVNAHANLGMALNRLERFDEAETSYRHALAVQADHAPANNSFGAFLLAQGRAPQAITHFDRACAAAPENAAFHWNLARALLLNGDFTRGWPEFEWRLRVSTLRLKRTLAQPQWTGQPIAGQTILLFTEGGFGDALQFVRFAQVVARRGARVLLQCQSELVSLLKSAQGISEVIPQDNALPQFQWQCPLQSLPLALGVTLQSIPASVPYLAAPAEMVAKWTQRLAGDSSLRVGLAWAGSRTASNARSRSLDIFAPLAQTPRVTFYSLQKGPEANQPVPSGMNLLNVADAQADFADTAALMANLDLVISVDTSVAHLAGAIGRPVWTLIPFHPDFRWLLQRSDSPWYPTMRLFRQSNPQNWNAPINRMAQELQRLER